MKSISLTSEEHALSVVDEIGEEIAFMSKFT